MDNPHEKRRLWPWLAASAVVLAVLGAISPEALGMAIAAPIIAGFWAVIIAVPIVLLLAGATMPGARP